MFYKKIGSMNAIQNYDIFWHSYCGHIKTVFKTNILKKDINSIEKKETGYGIHNTIKEFFFPI